MNELDYLRQEIDKIDKEIALLFNERMEIIKKIKDYKKNNNVSTLDNSRERYLLEENKKYISKEYQDLYLKLEKEILALSKEYQNK